MSRVLQRWRLILGKYAGRCLGEELDEQAARLERSMEFLYGREYRNRGLRELGPGSLAPSQLTVARWLNEVRELFPRETVEVIEKHALERYGLTELLSDPRTLEKLEPSQELLRLLLTLKAHLNGDVLHVARRIIRQVVEELKRRLDHEVRRTLAGRLNRMRHCPISIRRNFDALGTLRRNLKHYDRERAQLVVQELRFFERSARRLPWHVILCVDQSGSMVDSIIHSAVMAGILNSLPTFRVKLVVFDTSVVDLSDHVDDPVEVLMSVQLGGGTDIGKALRYCEQLVENPHRTVLVLVSDFCEGASPAILLSTVKRMAEARVRLLGLAALDGAANPVYDRNMAERLAECGMHIAALTPRRLAEWLVQVVS